MGEKSRGLSPRSLDLLDVHVVFLAQFLQLPKTQRLQLQSDLDPHPGAETARAEGQETQLRIAGKLCLHALVFQVLEGVQQQIIGSGKKIRKKISDKVEGKTVKDKCSGFLSTAYRPI